ncbi:MAG: hypothetical protein JNL60_06290 [Bacteroidia bacterium]|nr:hypothetical protein [Bacteroidia bacterium]
MSRLIFLIIIPFISFSQNNTCYKTHKKGLNFKNTLNFNHNQKQSTFKNGTDDEEKGRLFFYHSLGIGVLAVGQDPNLDLQSVETVGVYSYYSPKLACRLSYDNLAFFGSNFQILINGDLRLAAVLPISLGLSHCLMNSDSDDDEVGLWVFANAGLGAGLFLSADPEDNYLTTIKGPYVDFGFKYRRGEIKASILKAFKNTNDGFILGIATGIVF